MATAATQSHMAPYYHTSPAMHHAYSQHPPSPPPELSRKYSLPPIADLLRISDGAGYRGNQSHQQTHWSSDRAPYTHEHSARHPSSPQSSHNNTFHNPAPQPVLPRHEAEPIPSLRGRDGRRGSTLTIQPPTIATSGSQPSSPLTATNFHVTPPQSARAPYYDLPSPSHARRPSHSGSRSPNSTTSSSSNEGFWDGKHRPYVRTNSSSSQTVQLSSERYVCQSCQKAFSRPSSLRIHSHSHTGEKPFCCPHKGCGKAFSVRSNMKRHERGCHAERRMDIVSNREILPAAA